MESIILLFRDRILDALDDFIIENGFTGETREMLNKSRKYIEKAVEPIQLCAGILHLMNLLASIGVIFGMGDAHISQFYIENPNIKEKTAKRLALLMSAGFTVQHLYQPPQKCPICEETLIIETLENSLFKACKNCGYFDEISQ